MSLPTIFPPDSLPAFTIAHELDDDSIYANVPRTRGHSRLQAIATDAPSFATVAWMLDSAQMADLHFFYEETLDRGTAKFTARVGDEVKGFLYYAAKWVKPFEERPINAGGPNNRMWSVTGILWLDGEGETTRPSNASLAAEATIALLARITLSGDTSLAAEATIALEMAAPLAAEAVIALFDAPKLAAEATIALVSGIPLAAETIIALEQLPGGAGEDNLPTIEDGELMANISGAPAKPTGHSYSEYLDAVVDDTQGVLIVRGPVVWVAIAPPASDGWVLSWDLATGLPEWRPGSSGGGSHYKFPVSNGDEDNPAIVFFEGEIVTSTEETF